MVGKRRRSSDGMAAARPIITTKSQLARRLGISAMAVSKYVAKGLPVRRDGMVDQRVALRWVAENIATHMRLPQGQRLGGRGRPRTNLPDSHFAEARRLLQLLRAQRLRLEVDRLRGRLLDREEVTTAVAELGRAYHAAWLAWPGRIAVGLAAKWGLDALTVQRDLDAEVRVQLHALSPLTFRATERPSASETG
jgi:hypothetical protein